MKKKRALRILSLILLCALTFTACKKNVGTPEDNAASKDENTEEKDKDEQESWKIGFSGIDMENPYFLTLESAIKEELDGENCELIVKDPKTDPDMQASQIQEMIDDPGEYNLFMNRLQEYHGFDQSFQEKVDEAKN